MNAESTQHAQKVEQWLALLQAWYEDIAKNGYYQERVYCHFDRSNEESALQFTVVLQPQHSTPEDHSSVVAAVPDQVLASENTAQKARSIALVNHRPELINLLPTREQAQGKVVLRRPPERPEASARRLQPASQGAPAESNKALHDTQASHSASVSNFKRTDFSRFALDNALDGHALRVLSANQDLCKILLCQPPPQALPGAVSLPMVLATDSAEPHGVMQTEAGRYGMLLRASLLAKVSASKANVSCFINRLENLREIFAQADALPIPLHQRARILHTLWQLLDEVRETGPIISSDALAIPARLQKVLAQPPGLHMRDLGAVAWYGWNLTMPAWVEKHNHRLTQIGHALVYGAFAALLLLTLHPALSPSAGMLADGLAQVIDWRSTFLPDSISLAIGLAAAAGLVYGLTTQRLTLAERVALRINDKIEAVLDSTLADLMKANMDVQIGRLGRNEPPALMPENVARKLDEAFALKELINSYESTVRARRRHVAEEVGKAQDIRLESHQRLRNAALGVTASFVLLEIGSRIQEHRDLQMATDAMTYAYWLEHTKSEGAQLPTQTTATTPAAALNAAQDCTQGQALQTLSPTPACLDDWRDSALASSSQLLFLVFLIAMLIFAVRVMSREHGPDSL